MIFSRTCGFRHYSDLKKVFLAVWLIVSLVLVIVLVTPFIVKEDVVMKNTPECSYKRQYQSKCVFCGMTRSFYCISRGEFGKAVELNGLGLYLYAVFAINEVCVLIFILKLIKNRRGLKNAHH